MGHIGGGIMLNQKYYTVKELAEFMSLSEKRLRNMISNGEIKAVKIFSSLRIPESEVIKNIKERGVE